MENKKTKEEVFAELESGNYTLSYSSIKQFAKSPRHFMQYKIGDRVQTDAMKKGNIIHTAILEPELFNEKYVILKKEDLPFPELDFRNTENKNFKKSFEEKCKLEGKEIISPSEHETAIEHIDLIQSNEFIYPYISNLKKKEQGIECEIDGIKFRGYIDGIGINYELDIKTVPDANPSKFRWKIDEEKYHWQHFIYSQYSGIASYFDHFNLMVDGDGVSLHKISKYKVMEAEKEVVNLLNMFRKCIETNSFHMSYEFWTNGKGFYEHE